MTQLCVLLATLIVGGAALSVAEAMASTLEEALAHVYWTNPQLEARRAHRYSSQEVLARVLANWHPSIDLTGEAAYGSFENEKNNLYASHAVQLTLTQPLYRGGRTLAQVQQVESHICAEEQQLVHTEQTVLLAATIAYLNLWRDEAVLSLSIGSEDVLRRQMHAARERFAVGEITRTDVAQAETRLSRAQATRQQGVGAVKTSQAVYTKVIGKNPDQLAFPILPILNLPATREEILSLALQNSPLINAAAYGTAAAAAGIRLVQGERWPVLSFKANVGQIWRKSTTSSHTGAVEAILTLNVPLYQQGLVDARLRAAKHTAGQHIHEMHAVRRQAVSSAVQAWETLKTSIAQIHSSAIRIAAVEIALKGVQREAQVGSRTVLDVLDAEQERLEAHVELAKLKRDEKVSAFQLLAAVGRLTVKSLLGFPVSYSYKECKNLPSFY